MLANPRPIANGNTTRWNRRGSASQYHLTVSKKFRTGRNDPGWSESSEQPVIPPAPLTGDVGRDCGDASRALLFVFSAQLLAIVKNPARLEARRICSATNLVQVTLFCSATLFLQATLGVLLRELRWK